MAQKIYVGNLPYSISESKLAEMFEQHGEVLSVKLITDQYSGRSKGFGFVEMEDSEAETAIEALNGVEMEGRALTVNKHARKGSRGGGGGGRDRAGPGGGGGRSFGGGGGGFRGRREGRGGGGGRGSY